MIDFCNRIVWLTLVNTIGDSFSSDFVSYLLSYVQSRGYSRYFCHIVVSYAFYFVFLSCMQIPELDFEIPPEAQRGSLSTVCSLNPIHLLSAPSFRVCSGLLC